MPTSNHQRAVKDIIEKEIISGGKIPPAVGPFSPAVKYGNLLFVSGQAPINEKGELAGETIEEQTRQVFHNLRVVLEQAGTGMDNLLSVTVYLYDMNDWPAMNEVYKQQLNGNFPARTTVQSNMMYKGRIMKVEIQAVAHLRSQ